MLSLLIDFQDLWILCNFEITVNTVGATLKTLSNLSFKYSQVIAIFLKILSPLNQESFAPWVHRELDTVKLQKSKTEKLIAEKCKCLVTVVDV